MLPPGPVLRLVLAKYGLVEPAAPGAASVGSTVAEVDAVSPTVAGSDAAFKVDASGRDGTSTSSMIDHMREVGAVGVFAPDSRHSYTRIWLSVEMAA